MKIKSTDDFLNAMELLIEKNKDSQVNEERDRYSNKKTNRTFRLGKIDPKYASGRPSIIFDGETKPSLKKYPYLSSYTPKAGDIVLLAQVGNSYVVLGKRI